MIKEKLIPIYKAVVLELQKTSTCDRANVGAILIREGRIVASGYNGSVEGYESCNDLGHIMVEGHCVRVIHAEQNLLTFAAKYGIRTYGCIVFTSRFPCVICTKLLFQSGIRRIYYVDDYRNDDNIFKLNGRIQKV